MNTSDLLEQLLRASQGSASQHRAGAEQSGLGGLLGGLLGAGNGTSGAGGLSGWLGGLLGGGTSGAAPLGAPGRSGGGRYAMLASLGMMAFQAYQSWQRQQTTAPQQALSTVDQLAGPEVEAHSDAVLRALIAAAKADGTIDEEEALRIRQEIAQHADDPQLQQWLDAEVAKPLSATEVAQAAGDEPGIAAEMYLASILMVDDQQNAERDYLNELAAALKIDPQLQAHLEQHAKGLA